MERIRHLVILSGLGVTYDVQWQHTITAERGPVATITKVKGLTEQLLTVQSRGEGATLKF